MANLFLLALLLSDARLADLEALGVFNDVFKLFSWGDEVLLCQKKDNFLLLLDRNWHEIHRYDKAGQGPDELQSPVVFGLFSEKVVVLNLDRFVILDRKLQPVAEEFPHFTPFIPVAFGEVCGDNDYLVHGHYMSPFAAWKTKVIGGKWETITGIFPKSEARHLNDIAFSYQNGLIFARRDTPLGKVSAANMASYKNPDNYEIEVHDISIGLKENLVQFLSHGVAGLEGFDDKVLIIDKGFKYKERYYVSLVFLNLKKMIDRFCYLDTYAENGDFLGRKPVAAHWQFRPIFGSDRVVKLNRETMELFVFEP